MVGPDGDDDRPSEQDEKSEEAQFEADLAEWSAMSWGGDAVDRDEQRQSDLSAAIGSAGGASRLVGDTSAAAESGHGTEDIQTPTHSVFDEQFDTPRPDAEEVAEEFAPDFADFTADEYIKNSTTEYAGLAAAVAAAAATAPPEQAALSVGMPLLDSALVSLDDVVEAEGVGHHEVATASSDLPLRIMTSLGLVALIAASLAFRWSIGALIFVVFGIAAGELVGALVRSGYRPIALVSFIGIVGCMLGTWRFGLVAVPVCIGLTVVLVALFFGLAVGRRLPLTNAAWSVLIVVWIGGLAGFAFNMIPAPGYRWLIASVVVVVALMDIGAYFVGRSIGRRPLAPVVSPNKTVGGLLGGAAIAVAVSVLLSTLAPFNALTGLVLGAAIAIAGPFGDLAVSVFKRSVGVKDMGTILPGHGGVMDRVDAILFSLPAAWVVYSWAGLLT